MNYFEEAFNTYILTPKGFGGLLTCNELQLLIDDRMH